MYDVAISCPRHGLIWDDAPPPIMFREADTQDRLAGLEPRPEAAPLPFTEFTQEQQRATERLWTFIRFYLKEPTNAAYSRFRDHDDEDIGYVLPPINQDRRRTALLLDGGRGSGKTVVLVSLIDAWNRAARPHDKRELKLETFVDPDGRVIPIGLLDLRSLPVDTSLLLHVSMVLARLIDYLGGSEDPEYAPPTSPHRRADNKLRKAWDAYQQAVAAMELRVRGSDLDPESFADELRVTGRDRLDIKRLFGQLMDHAIDAFTKRRMRQRGSKSESPPVFIIAIDDADLDPGRVGECFELLERLEHPRLLFLFAGDSKVFRTSLKAQFVGELHRPFAKASVSDGELVACEIVETALELAERYYAKMIPPAHRCQLSELSIRERNERLVEILKQIPLGESNVARLLELVPVLGAVFPGTIRALNDFGTTVRALVGDQRGPLEMLACIREWLFISDPPPKEIADGIRTLVQLEPRLFPTPDARRAKIDASGFEVRFDQHPQLAPAGRGMREDADFLTLTASNVHVQTSPVPAWLIKDLPPPSKLSQPYEAFVLLANYVGWLLAPRGVVDFIASEPESGFLVATFIRLKHRPRLSWPSLALKGPNIVEFVRQWDGIHREFHAVEYTDERVERLALTYLSLREVCLSEDVLKQDHGKLVNVSGDEQLAEAWDELFRGASDIERRVSALRLAAPEFGLPFATALRIINAARDHLGEETWSTVLETAQQRHKEALSEPYQDQADWLFAEIDARFSDHPWRQALRADCSAGVGNPLIDGLVLVKPMPPDPSALPTWWPENATAYLDPELAEQIASAASSQVSNVADHLRSELERKPPEYALYRAWQETHPNPRSVFRLNLSDHYRLSSEESNFRLSNGNSAFGNPQPTSLQGLQSMVYSAELPVYPEGVEGALYWIGHDAAADAALEDGYFSVGHWRQMSLYWRNRARTGLVWPTVSWLARIDVSLLARAWNAMIARPELSISDIARRFVYAQINIFRDRKTHAYDDESWHQILLSAVLALEDNPQPHKRNMMFKHWLAELILFARPSAGIDAPEAAALIAAYIEFVPPTLRREKPKEKDIGEDMIENHPWSEISNLDLDTATQLRKKWRDRAPALFEISRSHRTQVEKLINVLRQTKTGIRGQTLGDYVTGEVEEWFLYSPPHRVREVCRAFDNDGLPFEKLEAAWHAAKSEHPGRIDWGSPRSVVIHNGRASAEPSGGGQSINLEGGRELTLYRGCVDPRPTEYLSEAIVTLVGDMIVDGSVSPPDDIAWPLITLWHRGKRGVASGESPWRSVAWQTRRDTWCTVESWNAYLGRKRVMSAPDAMRLHIAILTHTFSERAIFEGEPGSWAEVLSSALSADDGGTAVRDNLYRAWLEKLSSYGDSDSGLDPNEKDEFFYALELARESANKRQSNKTKISSGKLTKKSPIKKKATKKSSTKKSSTKKSSTKRKS